MFQPFLIVYASGERFAEYFYEGMRYIFTKFLIRPMNIQRQHFTSLLIKYINSFKKNF